MARILAALAAVLAALPAFAAAPPRDKPPPPAVACKESRDSPDYVAGVDVHGRAVAPADVPSSRPDIQVSTEVYAELGAKNPRLPRTGVVVNVPSLQAPPPCKPHSTRRN
jgi:hypothetical protein